MTKKLHTGLYTTDAKKLLEAAITAICSMPGRFGRKFNEVAVAIEPNGEVVFEASRSYYGNSSFVDKYNDTDALIWFARTMKWATQQKTGAEWKRFNTTANTALDDNFTIQETYLVYDKLINRKNLESKYSQAVLEKIVGKEKDAIATELETAKREEVKKLNEKWDKTLRDADPNNWYGQKAHEINDACDKLRKSLVDEAMVAYKQLKEQKQKELEVVEKMVAFATVPTDSEVPAFPFA